MEGKNLKLVFSNPRSIRKTLTKVANEVAAGRIDVKTANAIVYIANTILNSIRTDDIEKKIEELEDMIND